MKKPIITLTKFRLLTEIYVDDAKIKNGEVYIKININDRHKWINYSSSLDKTSELALTK